MRFIVYALVLACASLSTTWAQCTKNVVRKEIRQISASERNAFIQAVQSLKSSGKYDQLVSIHLNYVPYAHSTPAFFPWHRQYTKAFELALQSINPNVVLPYWDWTLDSQAPEKSPLWTWFGGNGRKKDGCVIDGAFANWKTKFPDSHCLQRKWDSGNTISAFWSPESINNFIKTSSSFDRLRNNIEPGPHGTVHNNIGGDFMLMGSPNDPIFFLHHAFIDKIWSDWQNAHPKIVNDYSGTNRVGGRKATVNDIITPFNIPVRQVLSTSALCYSYSQSSSASINSSKRRRKRSLPHNTENQSPASKSELLLKKIAACDRPDYASLLGLPKSNNRATQLTKLRPPRGLNVSFSEMMGYDLHKVRQSELENAFFLKDLNEIGYVSKISLAKVSKSECPP